MLSQTSIPLRKTWTIKSALKNFLSWNSLYASHRISAKLFLYFMTEIGLIPQLGLAGQDQVIGAFAFYGLDERLNMLRGEGIKNIIYSRSRTTASADDPPRGGQGISSCQMLAKLSLPFMQSCRI